MTRGITRTGFGARWKGGWRKNGLYIELRVPNHPLASKQGYVLEHVYVANIIFRGVTGRNLPKRARVHHVDADRRNNRPANLVICENQAYHNLLHRRLRAYRATGDPTKRQCNFCRRWDDPQNLVITEKTQSVRHPGCAAKYAAERRRQRQRT